MALNKHVTQANLQQYHTGAVKPLATRLTTVEGDVTSLTTDLATVQAIAEGRAHSTSYASYQAMITAVGGMTNSDLHVGDNIFVETLSVPDLWVSEINASAASYTYSNDNAVVTALASANGLKVGFYTLRALETQKVTIPNLTKGTTTGSGNAVTDITVSGHTVTLTKGTTFATPTDVDTKIAAIPVATTSANGLMSKEDKTFLGGLAGAATGGTGNVVTGVSVNATTGKITLTKATMAGTAVATTTANGLMSKDDKTHLENLIKAVTVSGPASDSYVSAVSIANTGVVTVTKTAFAECDAADITAIINS